MVFYVAWGKLIERREVSELSLPGAGREFAIGAVVGTALYLHPLWRLRCARPPACCC